MLKSVRMRSDSGKHCRRLYICTSLKNGYFQWSTFSFSKVLDLLVVRSRSEGLLFVFFPTWNTRARGRKEQRKKGILCSIRKVLPPTCICSSQTWPQHAEPFSVFVETRLTVCIFASRFHFCARVREFSIITARALEPELKFQAPALGI